jgi:phosphate:Na+ symporter
VIFNVATALVALSILPVLFLLIDGFSNLFDFTADAAISLALFHSVFNVLGVLLVYPFNDRIAQILEKRFRTWEEEESHPRFLDKNIARTPVLAVNALVLEIQSISDKVISVYSKAIHPPSLESKQFNDELEVIKSLSAEVSNFIVTIESTALSEETTASLAILMRVDQYFLSCTLCTDRIADLLTKREKFKKASLEEETEKYFQNVLGFMKLSCLDELGTIEILNERSYTLESEHDGLKSKLILEGTRSHISVAQMTETIDCLAEALRLKQQWFKGITRLRKLQEALGSSVDITQEPIVEA